MWGWREAYFAPRTDCKKNSANAAFSIRHFPKAEFWESRAAWLSTAFGPFRKSNFWTLFIPALIKSFRRFQKFGTDREDNIPSRWWFELLTVAASEGASIIPNRAKLILSTRPD